jgi:hypothetical protein
VATCGIEVRAKWLSATSRIDWPTSSRIGGRISATAACSPTFSPIAATMN